MIDKFTFQELQHTCQALGEFGEARSQEKPDKDLILTVKKINGRENLKTIRLSQMPWYARFVRWLGFGGTTLRSVADFLQNHEPYFPKFSKLKTHPGRLVFNYTHDAIASIQNLNKETWKKLRQQKIEGYEVFKRCLSHHNLCHPHRQVHILPCEYEKIDLNNRGVGDNSVQPMGKFPPEDVKTLEARYHLPILDPNKFLYVPPFFKKNKNYLEDISPQILGFCYEYGLGIEKNKEKAIEYYSKAVNKKEYSACYNLGLLFLKQDQPQEAMGYLKQAEEILLEKLNHYHDYMNKINRPGTDPEFVEKRERHLAKVKERWAPYVHKWDKALLQVYSVLLSGLYKK